MQVQVLPEHPPPMSQHAGDIQLGRDISSAGGSLGPAWQPSPTSMASSSRTLPRPSTPQRPHPGHISIPSSPPLDQPLFSAFPNRTPQTPRKGKERASDVGSPTSNRTSWVDGSVDSHGTPVSPREGETTLRPRRRGSVKRTPSYEALVTESGQSMDRPNPLGHTWGRPVDFTASPFRRQRRASTSTRRASLPSSQPLVDQLPHHERGMSASVDGHVAVQRRQQREASGQYTLVPLLPPGAMPASNPSATGTYDLTASQRYAMASASTLDASSVQVIHIPGRSSSIDLGVAGPLTASPPQLLKMDLPAQTAFTYVANADSQYTLQSISSHEISRPLVSPALSERRMDLLNQDFFSSKAIIGGLGLSEIENPEQLATAATKQMEEYGSLNPTSPVLENDSVVKLNPADDEGADVERRISLPSTVGTSSATTSRDFALSSASTSLSRSAKNGKEGGDRDATGAVQQALDDPFTTEAKVVQHERRLRKADQRKFILVELVETEVGYAEHLRDLVEIYVPQLAALPILSDDQRQAIIRNLDELAIFHSELSAKMVEVLRELRLGCESTLPQPVDEVARIESMTSKLCSVFVSSAPGFAIYDTYCAGSAGAMDTIRAIQYRSEWIAFEKRCRVVASARRPATLTQLLADEAQGFSVQNLPPVTLSSNPSRLMLRDLLILPIQRVCRYPLVLASLVNNSATPSPASEMPSFDLIARPPSVTTDLQEALAVMRGIAASADEANRRSLIALRTATIVARLEPHYVVSHAFVKSLGECILAGALDVWHQSQAAPNMSPSKVRYMGAFLYGGYLILVKPKRSRNYEARHYLPLEMFEMLDVEQGFLSHSVRLQYNDNIFELGASTAKEKEIWMAALVQAKEDSRLPPFNLPSSIFNARSRRMSTADMAGPASPVASPPKRHSLGPNASPMPSDRDITEPESPRIATGRTPVMAGSRAATLRPSSTLLMRTATPVHRQQVDKMLADVFSEECLACRHLPHRPEGPPPAAVTRQRMSINGNSVLRRRQSEVDMRGHGDESSRGMSLSRTFSTYGSKRNSLTLSIKRGLSIGSQEGFTALAQGSRHLQSTPSSPRSGYGDDVALLDSPIPDSAEFVQSPTSDTDAEAFHFASGARNRAGAPAYTQRTHSESSTASSVASPVIRRKSSFSISSLTTKVQAGRTRSVPASPAASRPVSLTTEPAFRADVSNTTSVMPSFGQVDEKLNGGYPKLRPASTFFGRTFRSKSFDGPAHGQVPTSQSSSPDEGAAPLPSDSSLPDEQGRIRRSSTNTAPSSGGSDISAFDASEAEQSGSQTEGGAKAAPRRQRSIRFFGLNRFTRISGNAT